MAAQKKNWIRVLDEDGVDIATLTPQVDRKLKRMVVYITLPVEPDDRLLESLGTMGFRRASVNTPGGNYLYGSTRFSTEEAPTKLKFDDHIPTLRTIFPYIQFGVPMERRELINFDYGMAAYHQSKQVTQPDEAINNDSPAASKPMPQESTENAPSKSEHFQISNADLLGFNEHGEEIYSLNGERYVNRDNRYLAESDRGALGVYDRTDFLRIAPHSYVDDVSRIAKGFMLYAGAKPDISQKDMTKYLIAINESLPSGAGVSKGELVAAFNRGIKQSIGDEFNNAAPANPQQYSDILPADDLIKRLPGAPSLFLSAPSITSGLTQALKASGIEKPRISVTNPGDGLAVFSATQAFNDSTIRVVMPDAAAYSSRAKRSRMHAFSFVSEHSNNVREVRHNITTSKMADNSTDLVLACYPWATIEQATDGQKSSVTIDGYTTERYEHAATLNALHGINDNGMAAIQLPSTGDSVDKALLDQIAKQYTIHGVARMKGTALFNGEDQLLLIAGDKQFVRDDELVFEGTIPEKLTLDDAFSWLQQTANRVHNARAAKAAANAPTSALSTLSNMTLSTIENKISRESFVKVNDSQIAYHPMTGTSKFADARPIVVPRDMARPIAQAHAKLRMGVRKLGFKTVTSYVADRLGYTIDNMESEKHFTKNQQDNLGLAIYRFEEEGKPFIIGDGAGVGKTRQAAGIVKYCLERDIPVVFSSIQSTIFNKLMKEMDAIDAEALLLDTSGGKDPVFVYNHDVTVFDSNGNPVYRGDNGVNKRLAANHATTPAKLIFLTSSQLARPVKRKKGESKVNFVAREQKSKVALIERTVKQTNPVFILDESHTAAGESNTNEVMERIITNARGLIYMSATAVPSKRAYSLYRRALPGRINHEMLEIAISKGGNAVAQAIATGLVSDGAFSCMQLADQTELRVSTISDKSQVALNEKIADEMAAVFDFYTSLTGEAENALSEVVSEENKRIRGAGDNDDSEEVSHYRDLGYDTAHWGSKVSRVVSMLNVSLNTMQAGPEIKSVIDEGGKVVYTLHHTGESLVNLVREKKGIMPDGSFEQPTMKDLANDLLDYAEFVSKKDGKGNTSQVPAISLLPKDKQAKFKALMASARDYIDKNVSDLPVNPIDILRNELQSKGFNVGEISGRKTHAEFLGGNLVRMVPKDRSEYDKELVIRKFKNGELDVVISTSAGATGNDMNHAENDIDQRPVKMIVGENQLSAVLHTQTLGRIARFDDASVPQYRFLDNGLPASKKSIESVMRKLGFLQSAQTGAVNQNSKITPYSQGVSLFTNTGNRAVIRYLVNNPNIARRLAMYNEVEHYINDDTKEIKYDTNATIASRFLGRLMMIPTAENKLLLEDVVNETVVMLEEDRIMGRDDSGGVRFLDIKGTEVSTMPVKIGRKDPNVPSNALTGDVICQEIEYDEHNKPLTSQQVLELVSLGQERFENDPLLGNGQLQDSLDAMLERKVSILVDALPSKERNQALNAASEAERHSVVMDYISKYKATAASYLSDAIDWLHSNLPLVEPGSVIKNVVLKDSLFDYDGVVTSISGPRKGQEHNLSQWRLNIAIPGKQEPQPLTLLGLYRASATDGFTLDEFDEYHDLFAEFDKHDAGSVKKRFLVLTGNMLEASLMMHQTGGGQVISWTDETGSVHRGFKLKESMSLKRLQAVKQNMTPEQAASFIKASSRHDVTNSASNYDSTKHVRVAIDPRSNAVTLYSPRNKTHGSGYAVGTTITNHPASGKEVAVNPLEHLTGKVWEFKKSFAMLEVPNSKVEDVLEYVRTRCSASKDEALYGNEHSLNYLNNLESDEHSELDAQHSNQQALSA